MSDWASTAAFVLGSAVVLYLGQWALGPRNSHPLPPGPPGIPWVGNLLGINASAPWITYMEWAKVYGGVIHSRLFGKDMIILGSEKAVKDLLENRSKNYSDRPFLITTKLCGLNLSSIFLPYGDRWRLHRRFFHQTFRSDSVQRFIPSQHRKACRFLHRLLESPEEFADHVFEYTTAIIMNSTYDYDPMSRQDELVNLADRVLTIAVPAVRPDIAVIVGAFPWLLYLPSWVPGMSFKKQMAVARECSRQYFERLFEYALQRVASDSIAPSMVHDALRGMEKKGVSPDESWMEDLKLASGTAFLAASETSTAALMTFFLVMVVHQDVQAEIHAQIDAAVGKDRLPAIEDRPSLPYLDAVIREMHRWNSITPLSAPHAAVEDDVYEGFHIPKGAILITNQWAISRDESRFPDPSAFKPERFLNDDGSLKPDDTHDIVFGHGRRTCSGRHFADASVWALAAKTMAAFEILRPMDENGMEVPVEPRFVGENTIRPLPFKCRIVPRRAGMDAEGLDELIAASTP